MSHVTPPKSTPGPNVLSAGGRLLGPVRGHVNTLKPYFARTLRPKERPVTRPFCTQLRDPQAGTVDVTGCYLERDPARVVVAIHGLGGSIESGYLVEALRAADALGVSMLLLNCRGADRTNCDFYHSGLTADLDAALKSVDLSAAQDIFLLGYSIGGHVALCYGCDRPDPRVRKIAVICAPLELSSTADDFDQRRLNVYRGHVMDGLKEIYTACYQRRPHGILPQQARAIHRIRSWDDQIVAPRFGFKNADDYYQSESVARRLSDLQVEGLYVGARFDPMVQARRVEPHLHKSRLAVVWDDQAGHLGFLPGFTLGLNAPLGLEPQVLSWLVRDA